MAYSVLEQMHDKLVSAEHPLLVADERLDGDSLGASLAMADYLLRLGKPVRVFISEPIPEKYKLLPHQDLCFFESSELSKISADVVVFFDCSDEKYAERVVQGLSGPRPLVLNIDHHITNPRYGHLHLVDHEAPATCEVVHRFFKENKITINKHIATCLFSGLIFDTTAFSNDATNAVAFSSASELMFAGARGGEAIRLLLKNRSVSALRLWGVALERLWFYEELQAVATCITLQDLEMFEIDEEEIGGLHNFLKGVIDHDTTCVMCEKSDGSVKISLRTDSGDVASIARARGGGGHAKAAGFSVPNSRLVCAADGCWRVENKL
ncbi:TPA: hypothetical protein DEA21_03520 [Candidatus Uhrbacteria bacterium]|nr:hypothetical protein [Candidatus Uhrbacteria bacterium]